MTAEENALMMYDEIKETNKEMTFHYKVVIHLGTKEEYKALIDLLQHK